MNAKRNIARGIILVLVSLVVASCASATPVSTPAPLPTTAPLACPTSAPLSCPTALAQMPPPQMNGGWGIVMKLKW